MALGMNYSVAGFRMVLNRKMSFYIVTYYLPSGLFVMVSWISFLVNPGKGSFFKGPFGTTSILKIENSFD